MLFKYSLFRTKLINNKNVNCIYVIWKPTNIFIDSSFGNTVAVKVSDLPTSNDALSLLIMTLVTWTMLGVTVIVVSPTATAVTFPSSTVATVSLSEV